MRLFAAPLWAARQRARRDGWTLIEGMVAVAQPSAMREVVAIVGPQIVVGAALDLHNHLSDAMVAHADWLVCFKAYPHTDVAGRAFELVDLCAATMRSEIHPQAAVADTGMIANIHTTREPGRSVVARMRALEGQGGVLSVSLTHGFPWRDVADIGTKVLTQRGSRPRGCPMLTVNFAAWNRGLQKSRMGERLFDLTGESRHPFLSILGVRCLRLLPDGE